VKHTYESLCLKIFRSPRSRVIAVAHDRDEATLEVDSTYTLLLRRHKPLQGQQIFHKMRIQAVTLSMMTREKVESCRHSESSAIR
jgi:hypothetical protein